MTSCNEICDLIHEWADGELSPALRDTVDAHLVDCEGCRRQASSVRRVKQLIRAKARIEPAPAGLEDRVRAAIAAQRPDAEIPRAPLVLLRWSWVRIAAMVVLVTVAGIVLQLQRPGVDRFLVHASMAREALDQHRDGPLNYRPKSTSEVVDYLESKNLPRDLPPFPDDLVKVVGLGSSQFGGWCDAVHLRYERVGKPGAFSVFVIPADIRLGPTEKRKPWHRGFCLCLHDGGHSVICFRRLGTYYSIVTDQPGEDFHRELLAWQELHTKPGMDKPGMDKPGMDEPGGGAVDIDSTGKEPMAKEPMRKD